ncbi:MAG TPA: hypothetical protein PLH70_00085 [Bacteroidales bacterium]|nr:hypothetical protein [Bacteroidales bacterium]HOH22929.1 hypothetical protein [Bacteroidales bacterium]HPZ02936.1 hypothetical protein [Bacteroidales bacterium]HQB74182.1 hypothetical protein [Bacteroidales bacterium]
MKRFLFLLVFSTSFLLLFGQRFSTFSTNPSLTVEEMKQFFETLPQDKQKEANQLHEKFVQFWENPFQSDESQLVFIDVANTMLQKRMRPFPHFESVINAYLVFMESEFGADYENWGKMLKYHVLNEGVLFTHIIENYTLFFTDNIIAAEQNATWIVYGLAESIGVDQEPYIAFDDVNLVGRSKQDSVVVFETTGRYYPSTSKWVGTTGELNWDRAGLYNVVAKFESYTIDTRFPKIYVENASLNYPDLFSYPIKGVLEDKAGVAVTEEKALYPTFKSYDNYLAIQEIYKNVDYIGGFQLRGASIQGSSDGERLAKLLVKNEEKVPIISVESASYLFRPGAVLANDAHVSIYMEQDSIFHPSANFKYTEDTKELIVSRPKYGVGRSPFFDTYHKMEITAESIQWKTDQKRIEIKPLVGNTSDSKALFESQNYYEYGRMKKLQGYNEVHPMRTLYDMYYSNQFKPVTLNQIVYYFRASETDIKAMIIELAANGFVEYDINKNLVHYRKKLTQYLNNEVGMKDYDNILLESKTHYATIDLTTFDLKVTGCEFFILSDAQIVNVYPTDEKVVVKKNRDMIFSGVLRAGLFDFVASNCKFDYDRFLVDIDVIDSLIMYTEDRTGRMNMYGEYQLRRVNSPIEELAGTLYIDLPGNKSGKTDHPDYPMFESRKAGKVFYDQPFVLNGVYDRERFWYHVDLFTIKNLDNFVIDSLTFNGRLISGGIFPDISEPLMIRPDFSLGFVHQTTDLPMYENRGLYTSIIDLSNRGLRGRGKIDFQTSTSFSDDFIFYLDSTSGYIHKHHVEPELAETEFPIASVKNTNMLWAPYQDQMYHYTTDTPVDIFGEGTLTGHTIVTSHGMYGGGIFKFKQADLTSTHFNFKHHELLADTANLRIYDRNNPDQVAFSTNNYHSHVDFQTRIGNFVANGEASEVLFVRNEFKAKAKAFEWNTIDQQILKFKWDDDPYKDIDINGTPSRELVDMVSQGNELICTDSGMRGLQFCATAAEFDFGENVINAHGVRFIHVGDAAVFPKDGEVTILEEAKIPTLYDSRILAGRKNKFHEIYNCVVNIYTAIDFKGSGFIDYIDENQMIQSIRLDTIWFYKTTQGIGSIPLDKDFKLSPHFAFDGRMQLNSVDTFLTFVGGVEFIHDCDSVKYARFRIMQQVNPNSIFLEIDQKSKDVNDRKAVVAIASSNRTGRIYTAFGVAKDQFNDAEYISVQGFITYDHESQEYRAAAKEKLEDPSVPGTIIRLKKNECISTGTGAIDMGAKLGRVDFITDGTILNFMKADSAEMHLTTSIDFFFNDNAMKVMNKTIQESTSLDFFDPSGDEAYQDAIYNILGPKDYQKYRDDQTALGQVRRLPEKLRVQFLFSDISFSWDKETSAFISQTTLPLIICGSQQVYKEIPGIIVIEKRGSRNRLYIYFEFDQKFFFFQFENNNMYGFSSEKSFNEAISKTKTKHRVQSPEKGLPSFSYRLGNRSQQRRFLKKFYTPLIEELSTDENE